LEAEILAMRDVNTQYVVARFSPDGCPAARLPLTFRYAAVDPQADYSLGTVVTFARDAPPVEIFSAYDVDGAARFDGVEVPADGAVRPGGRARPSGAAAVVVAPDDRARLGTGAAHQRLACGRIGPPRVFKHLRAAGEAACRLRDAHQLVAPPASCGGRRLLDDPLRAGASSARRRDRTGRCCMWWKRTPDDRFVVEGEVERGGITPAWFAATRGWRAGR
jgi:hypothetical protein